MNFTFFYFCYSLDCLLLYDRFGLIHSFIRVQYKAENHLKIDDTNYSVDDFKSAHGTRHSLHQGRTAQKSIVNHTKHDLLYQHSSDQTQPHNHFYIFTNN